MWIWTREGKLTQEFRTLGANVVIAPPSTGGDAALVDAGVVDRIAALRDPTNRSRRALSLCRRKFRNAARDFGGHVV